MKTKQEYMRATFTKEVHNAINYGDKKPTLERHVLIDKKTEREIVDCRIYGAGATVYCSIWIDRVKQEKRPAGWVCGHTSGKGSAGGYGYHKSSEAVAKAIRSAGIVLTGYPYGIPVNSDTPALTRALLKKPAHIGGCGDESIRCALLAIAYAAGYTDVIYA